MSRKIPWGRHVFNSHMADITFIASDETLKMVEGIKVTSLPGTQQTYNLDLQSSVHFERHFRDFAQHRFFAFEVAILVHFEGYWSTFAVICGLLGSNKVKRENNNKKIS